MPEQLQMSRGGTFFDGFIFLQNLHQMCPSSECGRCQFVCPCAHRSAIYSTELHHKHIRAAETHFEVKIK